jgi:hypothetical protein
MMNQRPTADVIEFNGIKFRRYPLSKKAHLRNYWSPSSNHRYRGVGALHVEIWKAAHGEIPEGHHIHHIDGNTLNNSLDNLECLSPSEHVRRHFTSPKRLARARKHIAEIRPLASEWHGSEEGKAWHEEHGKTTWDARAVVEKSCQECGEKYSTKWAGKAMYCSNRCKAKARRKSGVDDIEKLCPSCGKAFTCNRYRPKNSCSPICGSRLRFTDKPELPADSPQP